MYLIQSTVSLVFLRLIDTRPMECVNNGLLANGQVCSLLQIGPNWSNLMTHDTQFTTSMPHKIWSNFSTVFTFFEFLFLWVLSTGNPIFVKLKKMKSNRLNCGLWIYILWKLNFLNRIMEINLLLHDLKKKNVLKGSVLILV